MSQKESIQKAECTPPSAEDKQVIQDLAKRVADIAAEPIQNEKKKLPS